MPISVKAKVMTEGSPAPPASAGAPRRFQPSSQYFWKASLKPGGVRTTPFSIVQPCSSPTWFSGCSTSSQNFAPPSRIACVMSGVSSSKPGTSLRLSISSSS
jgi:hypothetical protein